MIQLSEEQSKEVHRTSFDTHGDLKSLSPDALILIISALQDQLATVQGQLDKVNEQLSDNNRQVELLTEQIRIMNRR